MGTDPHSRSRKVPSHQLWKVLVMLCVLFFLLEGHEVPSQPTALVPPALPALLSVPGGQFTAPALTGHHSQESKNEQNNDCAKSRTQESSCVRCSTGWGGLCVAFSTQQNPGWVNLLLNILRTGLTAALFSHHRSLNKMRNLD